MNPITVIACIGILGFAMPVFGSEEAPQSAPVERDPAADVSYVRITPPTLLKEEAGFAPAQDQVWIPGHWAWQQEFFWRTGHWATKPAGITRWIADAWEHMGGKSRGGEYHAGRWE